MRKDSTPARSPGDGRQHVRFRAARSFRWSKKREEQGEEERKRGGKGGEGGGRGGGRRNLLDSEGEEEEIKKRKDLEATSSQPYGISDKEQAPLLMKIHCQSIGPCRK